MINTMEAKKMALTTQSMGPKKKATKKVVAKEETKIEEPAPKKKEEKLVRFKDEKGRYGWKVE